MQDQAFLGIDLGTTEVKAGLVGLDGRLLAMGRAGYGLAVGHGPGWAEQDPGAWWSAVVGAVRALGPEGAVEVVAIGVDGHGPTLAAVDERGEATRPAITFLDTRATAEAAELADATGIRGWALGPLPAALWLERHEPDAAARTRWYLSTWEWLAFRLTGEAVAPLVPGQVVPDPLTVTSATGLDMGRRPGSGALGAIVGSMTGAAADALGLRAGIPVAGGTNDAFASYLGAGLTDPGDAYDPGGSAGGGMVVECSGCELDADGRVTRVLAKVVPGTKSGTPGADAVKVKGVIGWVGVHDGLAATVNLYQRLFTEAQPEAGGRDFREVLNPSSLSVVQAVIEPSLAHTTADTRLQFERHGYFVSDRIDHRADAPVFNRITGLKDGWAK